MNKTQKPPDLLLLTAVMVTLIGCTNQTTERLDQHRAE